MKKEIRMKDKVVIFFVALQKKKGTYPALLCTHNKNRAEENCSFFHKVVNRLCKVEIFRPHNINFFLFKQEQNLLHSFEGSVVWIFVCSFTNARRGCLSFSEGKPLSVCFEQDDETGILDTSSKPTSPLTKYSRCVFPRSTACWE